MKFKKIISLKSLIILGFVIAVIPLFLGVMYAAFAMRETAILGRAINYQVFAQTKAIRLVLQKSSDVERKARLFILLSDPALRQPYERESYENTRSAFKQALSELLKLHVDNKIALLANELSEKENLIYQQIMGSAAGDNASVAVNEAFQGLRESSNTLSREFESHVDHEFNELRQQSEILEQGLLIKGAVLLLVSFIFIVLLLVVLSRSMRQLDAAIRRLGSTELAEPIVVSGPTDLRYLGERLEWLRTHLMELALSKRQFIHNVACEIKTPLQEISEGAQWLASDAEAQGDAMRQSMALVLCANIEKLHTVSEELARYSQINAMSAIQHPQTVNLKEVLEAVIMDYQEPIAAKSLSIKKLLRPVAMSGVQEQLRGIIGHLLANAVQYSPVNGEIRIMLREAGGQVELEIEDEGPGIAPEDRSRVFEPFFRGKGMLDDAKEGAGLGLAIVKEYVANHQGCIDIIDSREDQQGARIQVRIPLKEL